MAENKQLLIVFYSRSGNTEAMANAVISGASDEAIEGVDVVVHTPLETTADHVMQADGIILGTPENFGYMSGAMKIFFETIYYPCLDHTQGLPYGLFIRAGNDGQGALVSLNRIIAGLRWKLAIPPVILTGEIADDGLDECRELGLTLAAGLEAGIF